MEAFKAKGYEVLLLTDPIDEMWVESVADYDGRKLRSIAKGQVDLDGDDAAKEDDPERQ
jgi:molecular chaperone HtpG